MRTSGAKGVKVGREVVNLGRDVKVNLCSSHHDGYSKNMRKILVDI